MKITSITVLTLATALLTLSACGGGSSNSPATTQPPPAPPPAPPTIPTLDPQYRASAATPFTANCDGEAGAGTVYANAEVEPTLAIDPVNNLRMVGLWQQDRWSNGGARGIVAGASADGGVTWTQHALPFSRCAGGTPANSGDYTRATDPWISVAPDGRFHALALAFNGRSMQPGSSSAMLATHSDDGGTTWTPPRTLIVDGEGFFNDKGSITADPVSPQYVYAVWDRLIGSTSGPTEFARSTDGGMTWEPARPIYDPGANAQTLGNLTVVLPNGTLIVLFSKIELGSGDSYSASLALIRSTDNGLTWSAPIIIADELPVGTSDPETGTRVRDASLAPSIDVGNGGKLYMVWQDSRFSSGVRDGVALSHSDDGGATWSVPTRVNTDAAVAAFSPSVHVLGDGTVGVSYYDFRSNTKDRATLYTDYWLARSANGVQWQESQIAGPFDLAIAPQASEDGRPPAYFIGDYQALAKGGNTFVPFFVQTNAGASGNRTDVFAAPAVSAAPIAAALKALPKAASNALQLFRSSPEWQRRVSDNVKRNVEIDRESPEAGPDLLP